MGRFKGRTALGGLCFLKAEFEHLFQVFLEFVQGRALRVCAGDAGDDADAEAGIRVLLYVGGRGEIVHRIILREGKK